MESQQKKNNLVYLLRLNYLEFTSETTFHSGVVHTD